MSRLEGILGFGILGLTVMTDLTYGVAEAKGGTMPGKEYIMPLLGVSGFCFGTIPSSPADRVDPKVGGVYAGVTAMLWGVSYGLGYLVEKLTS